MTTLVLSRDPEIVTLCPPRRLDSDRLYAEWVLNVASTLPESRDAYVTLADQLAWNRWQAEAGRARAFLGIRTPEECTPDHCPYAPEGRAGCPLC